jgi:hypothetical protein
LDVCFNQWNYCEEQQTRKGAIIIPLLLFLNRKYWRMAWICIFIYEGHFGPSVGCLVIPVFPATVKMA